MRSENYFTENSIETITDNWMDEINTKTRKRDNFQLIPSKTALIIMDMQNYFVSPNGKAFLSSSPPILKNIQKILDLWRSLNGKIFFTRHGHKGDMELFQN
jgi:isochorismate hydrolase